MTRNKDNKDDKNLSNDPNTADRYDVVVVAVARPDSPPRSSSAAPGCAPWSSTPVSRATRRRTTCRVS